MKTEFDKEIDALLRRGAHAAGRAARGQLPGAAASHLDADELSAFAENALPAPARASAASHLADCDECRGLVVKLAVSANVADEHERGAAAKAAPESKVGASSLGSWLSALFSPRVLRFAAPALALCLVGTVAYVVLRSQREGGRNVAQLEGERNTAPRPNVTGANASMANANANTTADSAAGNVNQEPANGPTGMFSIREESAPREAQDSKDEGQSKEPQQPDGADAGTAAPPKPVTQTAEVVSEAAPVTTAAPPPPPAAAPQEAAKSAREAAPSRARAGDDEAIRVDSNVAQDRAGRQLGNLDNVQAPDDSRNRARNYPGPVGSGRAATTAPPPRAEGERDSGALSRGPAARRGARDADKEDEGRKREEERKKREADQANEAETRSAGGHRFRREGSVWVDVNYRSSMSMTGVRRGTEQYRALVADVPVVGRVAEQLGGVVIVVVRGRAYRVQ